MLITRPDNDWHYVASTETQLEILGYSS